VLLQPAGAAALLLVASCSGESNSVASDALSSNNGGSSSVAGPAPTGGMGKPNGNNSGAPTGATPPASSEMPVGSNANLGNPPPGSGPGGESNGGAQSVGACPAKSSFTLGVHMTIPVSWPATLGTAAGSGNFELWNLHHFTLSGATLTGTLSPCGSELPPLTFSALIGGGKTILEFPDSVWDSPALPDFESDGSLDAWAPGGTMKLLPSVSLAGLTMQDPNAAWPSSYTGITPVDADQDGHPGITAIPATGPGLTSPPVSIVGPRVDQVHLVTRVAGALEGTFSSCTEQSGKATLDLFDNHVVGCRTVDGEICATGQTDFVDSNRTIYAAMPGTFNAKVLEDGATCEDVRAIP